MPRTMIALLTAAMISIAACTTTGTKPPTPNATTTTEPTARGAPAAPNPVVGCGETGAWNTKDESASAYSSDAIYLVRVGQHECYDRVVIDVNGSADVGFLVRYVPVVTADGSGEPVPVSGGAALAVIVHAPPLGLDDGGHQPGRVFARTGDHLAEIDGWRSLRAVRYAGFFEGQSTVAIGVREKLPFRVSTQLDETDRIQHVIIDIAHDA